MAFPLKIYDFSFGKMIVAFNLWEVSVLRVEGIFTIGCTLAWGYTKIPLQCILLVHLVPQRSEPRPHRWSMADVLDSESCSLPPRAFQLSL